MLISLVLNADPLILFFFFAASEEITIELTYLVSEAGIKKIRTANGEDTTGLPSRPNKYKTAESLGVEVVRQPCASCQQEEEVKKPSTSSPQN